MTTHELKEIKNNKALKQSPCYKQLQCGGSAVRLIAYNGCKYKTAGIKCETLSADTNDK
jgi:hypothetical protein